MKTFRALLEPSGMGLRSTFAVLPFDIKNAWPGMRVRRVKGEINSFPFATALFPTPRGHGFIVNKQMLAGAGVCQGERVTIRLEPDLEQRKEIIPEELVRAMKGAPGLRKWFDKLPPGHQRWIAQGITQPKLAAARERRAQDMAERLYLTMEGEKEPPPILLAAFLRQPMAEEGWRLMSPIRRRNHLFMIFGCRSAEARQKRLQIALDEAVDRVRSHAGLAPRRTPAAKTAMQSEWDMEAPDL